MVPKRKPKSSDSNTTMRRPTPEKTIKGFRFTQEQCSSLMIDEVFDNLPTTQWPDVTKLITKSIECYQDTLESAKVFSNIVYSLELIHQKSKNNTTLASYSLKCSHYLKQNHIRNLFDKMFASRMIKSQTEELKELNREQGHINATLITTQCNEEYYDELVSCLKSHKTLEDQEESEDEEDSVNQEDSEEEGREGQENSRYQEDTEDEEAEFPSDLTLDHHPQRTADYFLLHNESYEETDKQGDDDDWITGNFNATEKCKSVKGNTLYLKKNPGSLSDIRLLSLNDIYIFDEDIDGSVTKYFGMEFHKTIMSDINFNLYHPPKPNQSHAWCLKIVEDRPDDLKSTLKLCTNFLTQATEQDNEVDLHMAHALTQLLPVFVARSHDSSIEDSYVHHYLAPILQSVYSTDKKLTVRWANGALNEDSTFKPDFQVYSRIINVRCIVIVAEFKPKSRNSAVESDLIKLGKQMKRMYNDLVQKRVSQPTICGLLCQGEYLKTYVMDMPSPYTYRMVKLSKATLCRNIEELHLLPAFISTLVQVKNITLENVKKAEDCIVTANNLMQRQPCDPPKSWLFYSSFQLSRSSKKRKQSD